MANDLTELRSHLFDALNRLKTGEPNDAEMRRAKAVSDVAQVLIGSAKVEVEFIRVAGGRGTGFVPEQPALPTPPGTPDAPRLVQGRAMSGSR
jgi:hypothetical protein